MDSVGRKTGKPFYTKDTLGAERPASLERGGKAEVNFPSFSHPANESHNLSTRTRRWASQRAFRTHVDGGRIPH